MSDAQQVEWHTGRPPDGRPGDTMTFKKLCPKGCEHLVHSQWNGRMWLFTSEQWCAKHGFHGDTQAWCRGLVPLNNTRPATQPGATLLGRLADIEHDIIRGSSSEVRRAFNSLAGEAVRHLR